MVDTLPLLYYLGVAILGAIEAIVLILWPILLASNASVRCGTVKSATVVQQPRIISRLFGVARQEATAVVLEEGPSATYVREKIVVGYNKRVSSMVIEFAVALGLELSALVVLIWGQGVFALNGADVAQPIVFAFVAAAFVHNLAVYLGLYQPVRVGATLVAFVSFAVLGAASFFGLPDAWYWWAAHAVWFVVMALMLFIGAVVGSCTQTTVALLALLVLVAHSVIWLLGPSALRDFSLELWTGLWLGGLVAIGIFQICLLATYWSAYLYRKREQQRTKLQ